MSYNARPEAGDAYSELSSLSYLDDYEIAQLSGDAQDVAAYAAAIALAQEEYPGHFGHRQFTLKEAEILLNSSNMTTYALRDAAGGILGALTVRMLDGNVQFEYLFRLKAIRDNARGKQLLLRGMQHALQKRARCVSLDVMANNRARELYGAMGFEPYDYDLLDMDGSGNSDVISMRIRGEQAIRDAQVRLEEIVEQQFNPKLEQQSA